jgi:hypothetical protein
MSDLPVCIVRVQSLIPSLSQVLLAQLAYQGALRQGGNDETMGSLGLVTSTSRHGQKNCNMPMIGSQAIDWALQHHLL